MQTLRRVRPLARFVLAWMLLSLGVAVASPLVKPASLQVVCSVAGAVKLVLPGDGTTARLATPGMDCPLCVGAGAPPPAPFCIAAPGVAPLPTPSWARLERTTAPTGHGWLARGPPASA